TAFSLVHLPLHYRHLDLLTFELAIRNCFFSSDNFTHCSLILRPVNFRSHLQYEIILLISWDISSQSLIKWNPIIVIGSSPILNFSLKIRPFQHKRAWEETIVSCKY
ncbi:hypothetical protein RJ641_021809, partial [Dillenia turbinata]